MSKFIKLFIGVAVSALCLWVVFRGFDWSQLHSNLKQASYGWFVPAALLFCTTMTLRTVRWSILLSPLKKISVFDLMPVLFFGFFMNNILPARGGEVLRGVAANRVTGIPVSSAWGSIVIERLTDMVGLLMVLLIATRLLPWEKLPVLPIAGVFALGIIGGLVLIVFIQKYGDKYVNNPGLQGRIVRFISNLVQGFTALKSPSKMALVIAISCAIWLGEMTSALIVSRAMLFNLSFFESAGLLTGLSVGVMIPAAPGYIGTYEFFGREILVMLGRDATQAVSYVLVLHFFNLVMMAVLGIPSLLILQNQRKPT